MNKEELWKSWGYQFSVWIKTMQSAPIELIKSGNYSQSYESELFHVFKLEDGKYATVHESGCSCYDYSNAHIELFPNKSLALEQFKKWQKQQEKYKSNYE